MVSSVRAAPGANGPASQHSARLRAVSPRGRNGIVESGQRHAVSTAGRRHGARDARGFAFLELGRCAGRTRSTRCARSWSTSPSRRSRTSSSAMRSRTASTFFTDAPTLAQKSGYELVKFFFLLTFAAAIPAIVSGGIAERAKFNPQVAASFLLVALIYPFFEGIAWNQRFGVQAWMAKDVRRRVPRLRGQRGRARDGRLDRAGGRDDARRASRPLRRGRRHRGASAIVDPVPGARRVGADRRLVRLQRDVGAAHRQGLGTGGRELADGDGRRNDRSDVRRSQRPGLRAQRAARRPRRRSARDRTSCIRSARS